MLKHFNSLTPAEAERLAVLIEECNEVGQIACKILRHGYENYHPVSGEGNRELLAKEIGDLEFALQLVKGRDDVSQTKVRDAVREKDEKIWRYLHHNKRNDQP